MLLQQRLLKASLNALKGALPASQEGMILPLSSVGVRRQHAVLYLVVVSTVQERHRYTGRSAMKDHKDKGTGASDIGGEREGWDCSTGEEKDQGNLTNVCNHLKRENKNCGAVFFSVILSERKGNGTK